MKYFHNVVTPDNQSGIREAMAHLVAHGHRHIAFIAGYAHDPNDSTEGLQGHEAAIGEFGLESDPRLVVYGNHDWLGGQAAARQLLAHGENFTAILASDDLCARGAIDVLTQAGRRISQDIAIIGFDDQMEARSTRPTLTTIHQPGFRCIVRLPVSSII